MHLNWYAWPWTMCKSTFMESLGGDGYPNKRPWHWCKHVMKLLNLDLLKIEALHWNFDGSFVDIVSPSLSKEAYSALNHWAHTRSWKLCKKVPKMHQQQEIGLLGGAYSWVDWCCFCFQQPFQAVDDGPNWTRRCTGNVTGRFLVWNMNLFFHYISNVFLLGMSGAKFLRRGWMKTTLAEFLGCLDFWTCCVWMSSSVGAQVARMSRRCHSWTICISTMRRALMHYRRKWQEAGWIRRGWLQKRLILQRGFWMIGLPCVCSGVVQRSQGASCAIFSETDVLQVCVWAPGMQQDPEGRKCDSQKPWQACLLDGLLMIPFDFALCLHVVDESACWSFEAIGSSLCVDLSFL